LGPTGSYNFSGNAEANDENLLVIESRPIAGAYSTLFNKLYTTYGGKA
jgi:phosphatidylserine/phosphatidylglycerophosphate/cardiolipin synthase-like enzyme